MKEPKKELEQIAALLSQETTLSLATAGQDGEPWVAPLFYIADEELSLCWLSSQSSLHSQNLKRMPLAAATVYRAAGDWRQIRGVQMRGTASLVTGPELRAALLNAYCKRFKLGRVLRLAAQQSALFALQPEYIRFVDNARGFRFKFELTRRPGGWTLTRGTG